MEVQHYISSTPFEPSAPVCFTLNGMICPEYSPLRDWLLAAAGLNCTTKDWLTKFQHGSQDGFRLNNCRKYDMKINQWTWFVPLPTRWLSTHMYSIACPVCVTARCLCLQMSSWDRYWWEWKVNICASQHTHTHTHTHTPLAAGFFRCRSVCVCVCVCVCVSLYGVD